MREQKLTDNRAMEKFILVLEKIQDCIEMQNGASESQLKTIWNELSEAITESERRQKADTGENNALLPDVSAMLPDEKDEKYQEDRNEICFRAFIHMQQHLVRKNVETGFDLGVRYIKTLLGNLR